MCDSPFSVTKLFSFIATYKKITRNWLNFRDLAAPFLLLQDTMYVQRILIQKSLLITEKS